MKIQQLPIGARFQYEGEDYVKTGPLLATANGRQRLIPKYAVLKVLDGSQPVPEKKSTLVGRDQVILAFERFCAECLPAIPEEKRAAAEAARAAFLKALD